MLTETEIQNIIDYERGWLDRKHGAELGWTGSVTAEYIKGYEEVGPVYTAEEHDAITDRKAMLERGWI